MFTGRRYDAETGLYFYQSRYYYPHLARFIQAYPVLPDMTSIGLNRYTYCNNNPLKYSDPTGHWSYPSFMSWFNLTARSARPIYNLGVRTFASPTVGVTDQNGNYTYGNSVSSYNDSYSVQDSISVTPKSPNKPEPKKRGFFWRGGHRP